MLFRSEMGSYNRWELKLGKKTTSQTSPLVKEWADMLLFMNYKIRSVAMDDKGEKRKAQGGQRVIYTTHHPCWDAKNRYGLPEEMDFDYHCIAHIIEDGEPAITSPPQKKTAQEAPAQAAPPPAQPAQEPSGTDQGSGAAEQGGPGPEEQIPADEGRVPMEDDKGSAFYIDERIPKALRDLMIANTVLEEEIQAICEARMYVPMGTPMHRYAVVNPGLNERIVAYWEQIYKEVREMRDKQEVPFS